MNQLKGVPAIYRNPSESFCCSRHSSYTDGLLLIIFNCNSKVNQKTYQINSLSTLDFTFFDSV